MQAGHGLPKRKKGAFENKFGDYRCIVVKHDAEVTLFSRKGKVLNKRFRKVAHALVTLAGDVVLDGELVAFAREAFLSRCRISY